VYLAAGCLANAPAALAILDREILAQVPGWVSHMGRSPAFGDEVRQRLAERLLVGESPRLADYAGRGALAKWARVAATRVALNLLDDKHERHARGAGGDSVLEILPAAGRDADLDLLRGRYAAELSTAVKEAIAELPREQRVLLRLAFIDGHSGERIAALFKVNRSTVSRWLRLAREAVMDGARRRLAVRLKLTLAEVDSLARALHSQLDLSIRTAIGE
jgi:RNA polymerase sigma-70 factor